MTELVFPSWPLSGFISSGQLRKPKPQISGLAKVTGQVADRKEPGKASLSRPMLPDSSAVQSFSASCSMSPDSERKKPRGSHPQSLSGQQLPAGQDDPTLPPAARHRARHSLTVPRHSLAPAPLHPSANCQG